MDYGRKIMEKYGYKEGEGLGKQNSGILAPIKASFKFDQTGLGGKDEVTSQDNWWERVYTEAANNVNVISSNGHISIDLNDKDGVEITNKSYSMKKLKESGAKLQYGNFLKSATLLADVGEEKELEGHITTTDIEIKPFEMLNDDELFKACDGRTAHKGARHGLNLSGKLQRIADQEKEYLERLKNSNKTDLFKAPSISSVAPLKKPLLELNSSKDDSSSDEEHLPLNLENDGADDTKRRSKKRKYHQMKKVEKIINKIDSVNLDQSVSVTNEEHFKEKSLKEKRKEKKKLKRELKKLTDESEEEKVSKKIKISKSVNDSKLHIKITKEVHVDTPVRKKKTAKNKLNKLEILTESNEKCDLDDDIKMDDSTSEKQSLRLRLKVSKKDKIDQLNSIHHQNVPYKHIPLPPNEMNFESSEKKEKKMKKRKKTKWEKKQEMKKKKIDKKKQKSMKNSERREEKVSAKKLKKLAKKVHLVATDSLTNGINSFNFS